MARLTVPDCWHRFMGTDNRYRFPAEMISYPVWLYCRFNLIHRDIEELDAYIRWYNEKRIKISLGYLSPVEYREGLGLVT